MAIHAASRPRPFSGAALSAVCAFHAVAHATSVPDRVPPSESTIRSDSSAARPTRRPSSIARSGTYVLENRYLKGRQYFFTFCMQSALSVSSTLRGARYLLAISNRPRHRRVSTAPKGRRSGRFLHDLEPLGLQFEHHELGQMRAFLRLDPVWASPIRVVFPWVTDKGRADCEFDHIFSIIGHGYLTLEVRVATDLA
jgi:hypothetical protein